MTGPLMCLLFRQHKTIRRQQQTIKVQAHTIEVQAQRVQALLRDCDLLALMAKDRGVALAVMRDAHAIDGLEEASGG